MRQSILRRYLTNRETALIVLLSLIIFAFFFFQSALHTPVARESARKATCQTNLHRLGLAFQMYLTEYNGVLPSSAACKSPEAAFRQVLGQVPLPKNSRRRARTIFELMSPYIKRPDICFCPADPTLDTGFWLWKGRRQAKPSDKSSYFLRKAINEAWLNPKVRARREKDYNFPPEQVLLYESKSFHWGGAPLGNGASINVLYFDTHVKTIRLSDYGVNREPDYYNWIPTVGECGSPAPVGACDPRRYCDRLY